MPYLGQSPSKGDENNFKILDDISSYTLTFDGSDSSVVSAANDTITSLTHRFVQGQRVTYNNGGGSNIAGLTSGTVYYIIKHDHHNIKLATSSSNAANGTAVNITNVGGGASHTINVAFDGVNTKFKATHTNGQKAKITRSAQLVISINGIIQQPHDTATPSTGFGFDLDGTIVFSQAPVAGDEYWAHVLTNNNVTFDISDNDVDNFTGNGSTVSFNLSKTPPDNRNVLVTIDGVVQYPNDPDGTVRAYNVVENVLTFTVAPDANVQIQVRHIGFAGSTTSGVTNFYGRTGSVVLTNSDNITVNDANITGNLTVDGDFTTLNTTLREVELLRVDANSSAVAGIITQRGSGDILNLYDSSTEVFSVDASGRVKIGTTSNKPAADNEAGIVFGDNTAGTVKKGVASFCADGAAPLLLTRRVSGGNVLGIADDAGTKGLIRVNSSDLEITAIEELRLSTGTGHNEKVRLTNDGKVGINESANINGRLHVQHDALSENILYASRYNQQSDDKPLFAVTEAQIDGMTSTGLIIGNHNKDIHLGAVFGASAVVAPGERKGIRIGTGYGQVGINTSVHAEAYTGLSVRNHTTPDNDTIIDIVADDDKSSRLYFSENSNRGKGSIRYSYTSDANFMSFYTNGTAASNERVRILSSGNVGINSTSPANKLDVRLGAAWIYPDEDGTEAIALKLGKLADYNTSFNDILVADNDGSSSPTYRVTSKINRYIANWAFDRADPAGRLNAFQFKSEVGPGGAVGNTFTIRDLKDTADSFKFWTNGNSYVGVTTDGTARNFGIGTNNPTKALHVSGSAPEIFLEHTGGYDMTLTTSDGMGQNGITVNGGFLSLAYNNKNIVMCRTGGSVGINSTSPREKLDIGAGRVILDPGYQLTWATGTTNRARVHGDSGNNFIIENGSSNTERLRIDTNGRVGIHTTVINAQLEIGNVTGGNMNATGIQVNRPHSLGLKNGILVYTDGGYNNSASYRAAAFKAVGTSGVAFGVSTDQGSNGLGGTLNARINFDGSAYFADDVSIGQASSTDPWGATGNVNTGVRLVNGSTDYAIMANSNTIVAILNRTNTGGTIVEYKYNSNVVGEVITDGTDMHLKSSAATVMYTNSQPRLTITSAGLIRMGNGAEGNTEAHVTAAIFQNTTGAATILKLGNTNTPSSANNRAIEFCDGAGGTEGSSKYTYARIKAERTGGSNAGRLIFSTKPDNSNGPSEALRISNNGQVCVGSGFIGGGGHLTIRGGGVNTYATQDYQYVGTPSNGTALGQIRFTSNTSGASVIQGAKIQANADAAWSATGDAPTRLQFYTAPDGSANALSRLTITAGGTVYAARSGANHPTQSTLTPELQTSNFVVGPMFYWPLRGLSSGYDADGPGYVTLTSSNNTINFMEPEFSNGYNSLFQAGFFASYSQPWSNTASNTKNEDISANRVRVWMRVVRSDSTPHSGVTVKFNLRTYHYTPGWTDLDQWDWAATDSARGFRWVVSPWIATGDFSNWADVPGLGLKYDENSNSGCEVRIQNNMMMQFAYFV